MKRLQQYPVFFLFGLLFLLQGAVFLIFSWFVDLQSMGLSLSISEILPLLLLLSIITLTVLLLWAVRNTYTNPIRILRTEIAYFLAWAPSPRRINVAELYPDLSYVAIFFHRSLEILKNFKEEFQSGRVLRSEVELAADIQKNVLKKSPVHVPSLEIVADSKSATEVGGDSYDVLVQGDNVYMYIGDVTGHGVASGFVMMVVNALVSWFAKILENSADILARTNEILKPRIKSNMLMTLLMVRWNEREKKLYMTGAGHEYLLLYKKSQNKVHALKSGGVALGMTRDVSKILKEVRLSFEPGDCIVLYTDGITEARNGNKESDLMFGVNRLMDTIQSAPIKTARGIFNHITLELSRFMGYKHRQFDDITLIVIRYKTETDSGEDEPMLFPENITEWNWNK